MYFDPFYLFVLFAQLCCMLPRKHRRTPSLSQSPLISNNSIFAKATHKQQRKRKKKDIKVMASTSQILERTFFLWAFGPFLA